MNNQIEYAEMLDIPVNTVNIVQKRKRKRADGELKDKAIAAVNERVSSERTENAEQGASQNSLPEELVFEENQAVSSVTYDDNRKIKKPISLKAVTLAVEFGLVCVLCATIFITNIFMESSAINSYMRMLIEPSETTQTDSRTYSDFALAPVVSELAEDVEMNVSSNGVLSFTGKCSVYPSVNGKVSKISQADGLYTVEIKHSDLFASVINGLTDVYASAGDAVYFTLPIGYSNGENAVSVTFYDGEQTLNCYASVNGNDLVWNS